MAKHKTTMLTDGGGCGYWRCTLPALRLTHHHDMDISVVEKGDLLHPSCATADTIVIERLADGHSFAVMRGYQAQGKRIVYDCDDDLFNLAPHNPAHHFMTDGTKACMRQFLEYADVVTTTTERLKASLLKEAPTANITVIPNSIAVNAVECWRPPNRTRSRDGVFRMLWQGSASHVKDWEMLFPAVDRVFAESRDAILIIMGYLPMCIRKAIKDPDKPQWVKGRIAYVPWKDLKTYRENMYKAIADVGLAPLEDDYFNANKSAVKALEYAVAGIPGIYSPVGPYIDVMRDGREGLFASTPDEWYSQMMRIKRNKKRLREKIVLNSRKMVKNKFDLGKWAPAWIEVLTGEKVV